MSGKTKSNFTRSQRRVKAFELYSRGYTAADVAKELNVTYPTALKYKQTMQDQLDRQAADNPNLLKDVLRNTIQTLDELDQIRAETWKAYNQKGLSPQTKAMYLNTMLKAQDQRAKLFGIFGVKHEYFVEVRNIQFVQNKLLEFMRTELCQDDRDKLIRFIDTELREYLALDTGESIQRDKQLVMATVAEHEGVYEAP